MEYEEPSPPRKACYAAHLKDSYGYEPGKCRSADVGCEEDRDSSGNFLASIENREHVEGAGVKGGFGNAEEETSEEEALEVLCDGGEGAHDSPECHGSGHEEGGSKTSHEHV